MSDKIKNEQEAPASELTRLLGTRNRKYRLWDGENLEYFENWHELISLARIMQDNFDNDDFVVTEFTGIEDDNGNEIYEGDIVKVGESEHSTTHIVIWGGEYYPAFTLKPSLETTENVFSYLQLAADRYEQFWIAGNAFENTELLDECT